MTIIVAIYLLAALCAPAAAGTIADAARVRIAQEYGLNSWDRVEELRYTFNVRAGEREVRRSWIWRVKERTVSFRDEIAGGDRYTYSRDDVGDEPSDELRKVDHRFINDQYWLLFALHIAWDTDATAVVDHEQPLPIGEGTGTKVTVQYPPEGGYTPGDAYDVFLDADIRIVQWVFREGGQPEASLATTWEDQQRFGPLLIPTRFRSSDGTFEVWFSGVEVKTAGDDD